MSTQPTRRTLLKSLALLSAATALEARAYAVVDSVSPTPLPPRSSGELDIHHIDTGCGNCTLVVAPDGTTLMIDAGASIPLPETSSQPRPNASRRPGEWQARYALRHSGTDRLDFFVTTHIHPDHIGDVKTTTPQAASGSFQLTGVSDVDKLMPITTLIDRAYPDYGATPPPEAPFSRNYLAYLKSRIANGRSVQRAMVGSDRQIPSRALDKLPAFNARILAANGAVWIGKGSETSSHLANTKVPGPNSLLSENSLCVALRLTYGRFSYFSGGDLNNDTHDGQAPSLDIETPVARAAGRTEVAAADHHGYFDACGPEFVRALDAQAYIIQAWDIGHPGSAQVQRLLGAWSQKATHDVFATDLLPANQLMNRRFSPLLKSRRGHVVVRVASGGDTYRIFVLNSSDENDTITATFGPYICRA